VKSNTRWRAADGRVLKDLKEAGTVQHCIAVYGGDQALQDGPITVLPFNQFAQQLTTGRILSRRSGAARR
jgi:hypothetical protein